MCMLKSWKTLMTFDVIKEDMFCRDFTCFLISYSIWL